MKPRPKLATAERGTRFGSLLVLGLLAPIAGAASGLLGALFRLALAEADRWRATLITAAQHLGLWGLLLVVLGCALSVGAAAWLVRRYSPYASGSGIPHVEAVLNEEVPAAPPALIPVKFVGGVLAIGAGLALGREGPTVQMGAAIAHLVGKVFRRNWADCRVLLAAGAGAGLATAFNAPIAGAVFVLEELVRRFEAHIAIAALGASAAAIAVARAFLGEAPDFAVKPLAYVGVQMWPFVIVLGAVAGVAGTLYNLTLLRTLAAADRLGRWPVEARAAMIGAAVGALAWFLPALVGGGDDITQRMLSGGAPLTLLALAFLLRFGLGAVSYAAATPGGLFARSWCSERRSDSFSAPCAHRPSLARISTRPPLPGRYGSVLYRGRSISRYWNRARHRDDWQFYDAIADDRGQLCGDACAQLAGQRADLRCAAGADYSSGR